MSNAMVELPDFVNDKLVEHTYIRMKQLQDHSREPFWNGGFKARRLREIGVRMAVARDPRLLKFLDEGEKVLRRLNDMNKSMIEQHGYQKMNEFTEYGIWRSAFEKAVEPNQDREVLHAVFGWCFAAVAEALGY